MSRPPAPGNWRTVCGRCGGHELPYRAERYDAIDDCVTGFQDCVDCGAVYLYRRDATAGDRPTKE